jgi:phosphatidylglycerophosphate synthase
MLDPWTIKLFNAPINFGVRALQKRSIKPDQVTIAGFCIGGIAFFTIWMNWYSISLFLILWNRFMDGLDGALARATTQTDAGGFLDICLDFIFYSGMVAAFALADPPNNAIPAVFLILSFVGTGTSFLAFAVMAQKNNLESVTYSHKSLYYMGGLTEGTETILFFAAICLFPHHFPLFAILFALLCLITTLTRIVSGYTTLRNRPRN